MDLVAPMGAGAGERAGTAIEVEALTKHFKGLIAVDHVSFAVARGSVTGLLGGNGAGKSTTIGMIMGLILPTSGRVNVLGVDMLRDRYRVLGADEFRKPLCRHAASAERPAKSRGLRRLYGVADIAARIALLAGDLAL